MEQRNQDGYAAYALPASLEIWRRLLEFYYEPICIFKRAPRLFHVEIRVSWFSKFSGTLLSSLAIHLSVICSFKNFQSNFEKDTLS